MIQPFYFYYKLDQHIRFADGSRVMYVAVFDWPDQYGNVYHERYYIHMN